MISRRSPLPRRRAALRKWGCPVCHAQTTAKRCPGCKTRKGTARRSLTARADLLWAKIVKGSGVCAAAMWKATRCIGPIEAAHVVPRRHRSTRWLVGNGRALCHEHHRYYTDHEADWRRFIGPDWDRLWDLAQERWDGRYPIPELLATLAQEVPDGR